jgi:hypothetical protein
MSTAIAQELKPWLKIQLDECPDVCPLSTFEPLVLPRTTNMGRLGIVVGLMHHQTPLLGKFMEYYQQQFGASHFVFYTNESWVPAQVGYVCNVLVYVCTVVAYVCNVSVVCLWNGMG